MSIFKGWLGERLTQFGMWASLNSATYPRIHDLIIEAKGGTTQIDHVIVSVFGIFVIETKNMNGWIFGEEKQSRWTQSMFGKKSSFQNPLHQNYRHTMALAELLNLPHEVFHSVVFFIGDATLKTKLPENVMTSGLSRHIRSFTAEVFSPEEAGGLFRFLLEQKWKPVATHSLHVARLKERHDGRQCPKWEGELVLRTAKRGANAGRQFLGCSCYPKCVYARNVE